MEAERGGRPISGGGYSKSSLVSTFAAAFPMDDPQYVVLSNPDEADDDAEIIGLGTGGWMSETVVALLVPRIGLMLGVVIV